MPAKLRVKIEAYAYDSIAFKILNDFGDALRFAFLLRGAITFS